MNTEIYNWYKEYGLDFELDFFIKYEEILTKIYFEFMLENSNRFGLSFFLRSSGLDRYLLRSDITHVELENEYGDWVRYCEEAKIIRKYITEFMG